MLVHFPRARCIGVSAVAGQIARGTLVLVCALAQNQAADVGAERFEQPPSRVKVTYLIQTVAPSFWAAPDYDAHRGSILGPSWGPRSASEAKRQEGKFIVT